MDESWIHFSANVNDKSCAKFIEATTKEFNEGKKVFNILISTVGGSVVHGLTMYNFLLSLPVQVKTYNVGQVHSIGGTFFLAGDQRYAVPSSYFLIHSVGINFQNTFLESKTLKEKLGGIEQDTKDIARIFKERTKIEENDILDMMNRGITLSSDDALIKGILTDTVKLLKIPENTKIISITD